MEDRNARSDRDLSQFRDEGHRARLVGSDRRDANRPDRGSLRRRGRDEGSEPGGEEIGSADDRRPLHLPPSDLVCDRRRREAPSDAAGWPIHEVGRNADFFDPDAGRLLKAGSKLVFSSAHMHASGVDTKAAVQIGFKFHPKGLPAEEEGPAPRYHRDAGPRHHGRSKPARRSKRSPR